MRLTGPRGLVVPMSLALAALWLTTAAAQAQEPLPGAVSTVAQVAPAAKPVVSQAKPVVGAATSSVQNAASSVQTATASASNTASHVAQPVTQAVTPSKPSDSPPAPKPTTPDAVVKTVTQAAKPVEKAIAPVQHAVAPVEKALAPAEKVIAPVVEQATAPVQPIVTTVETTLEPLVPGTETVERVAESVVDDLESIVDPVSPISLPSLAAPTPALTHEPKAADPPAPSADESDTVSESHGPDKNVDVLADTTALVDVAPALVIPVVATLDIHAAATTPSASASANAAVTQPHTKGQTAFVEPTAPTAAPQTSPSLVDSLANLMALQTPDADLSSPDVAAIMLGPARLTSVGLLDRMVSLEATSLKATPIGGSHQPMPPPLPVPQSALPPPVSAPASLLLGTAGSAGAAPPILAFLSLAAAWHTLWLVAGVRPAGITLPSLAPPG